jgi:hypothetical protein
VWECLYCERPPPHSYKENLFTYRGEVLMEYLSLFFEGPYLFLGSIS